jgi:hypothetical protein
MSWLVDRKWSCLLVVVCLDDYCPSLSIIIVLSIIIIISMHLLDYGIFIYCFILTW